MNYRLTPNSTPYPDTQSASCQTQVSWVRADGRERYASFMSVR